MNIKIKIYKSDDGTTMRYMANNGTNQINCSTDGTLLPHMEFEEFVAFSKKEFENLEVTS